MDASPGYVQSFSLISLSTDILSAICSNWLRDKELSLLDVACASHSLRSTLLEVFREMGFCVDTYIGHGTHETKKLQFMTWLSERKLSVKELSLCGPSLMCRATLDYRCICRNTKIMFIKLLQSAFATKLVSLIPQLEELTVESVSSTGYAPAGMDLTWDGQPVCHRLSKLTIGRYLDFGSSLTDYAHVDSSSAGFIGALDCCNLKEIVITGIKSAAAREIIEKLSLSFRRDKAKVGKIFIHDVRDLDDDVMGDLLRHCAELTEIVFQNCAGLSERSVALIGQFCPNLTKLVASGSFEVQVDSNSNHGNVFSHLGEGCPALQSLAVSSVRCFDDDALIAVFQHMSALKTLSIDFGYMQVTTAVYPNTCQISSLREVEISSCRRLETFMELCAQCPSLTKLTIGTHDLTDNAWSHFFTHGINLTTLICRGADLSFISLADVPAGHLSGLCTLKIYFCENVERVAMHEITRICPNVREVYLEGELLKRGVLGELGYDIVELTILVQDRVRSQEIVETVGARPSIKKLVVNAPQYTVHGQTTSLLLDLTEVKYLGLEHLHIIDSELVDETVVAEFLASCSSLRMLAFGFDGYSCSFSGVTVSATEYIENLQRKHPGCRIVQDDSVYAWWSY